MHVTLTFPVLVGLVSIGILLVCLFVSRKDLTTILAVLIGIALVLVIVGHWETLAHFGHVEATHPAPAVVATVQDVPAPPVRQQQAHPAGVYHAPVPPSHPVQHLPDAISNIAGVLFVLLAVALVFVMWATSKYNKHMARHLEQK